MLDGGHVSTVPTKGAGGDGEGDGCLNRASVRHLGACMPGVLECCWRSSVSRMVLVGETRSVTDCTSLLNAAGCSIQPGK